MSVWRRVLVSLSHNSHPNVGSCNKVARTRGYCQRRCNRYAFKRCLAPRTTTASVNLSINNKRKRRNLVKKLQICIKRSVYYQLRICHDVSLRFVKHVNDLGFIYQQL
jgi:hypothetical protein